MISYRTESVHNFCAYELSSSVGLQFVVRFQCIGLFNLSAVGFRILGCRVSFLGVFKALCCFRRLYFAVAVLAASSRSSSSSSSAAVAVAVSFFYVVPKKRLLS